MLNLRKYLSALAGFFAGLLPSPVHGVAPMRSTDFKAIVEPILNEVFDGIYEQRKDEWKDVFKVSSGIPRSYHEEVVEYGMPMAPEMPDGMPVVYKSGGVHYQARYNYKVYGLAYALTQVLIEDGDHIQIGKDFATHLAQSMIETKETLAANILNRAFNGSFVGGDQVALCVTNHPTPFAGVQSNVLATPAALSQTSLEQMLIQIRSARDAAGKFINLQPKNLVVASGNTYQAEVLLKSVLRAGTNNNDINPVKSMGDLGSDHVVISRLTSPTAWFVTTTGPSKGLQLKTRRALTKSMEGDFETDSVRYKATERYAFGWTDWRGIYGTPGA